MSTTVLVTNTTATHSSITSQSTLARDTAAGSGNGLPTDDQRLPPTAQQVQAAVQDIQKYLAESQRTLEFQVDESSGISVVLVRDTESGDLIRQIPNEETVKLAQLLKEQGTTSHALLSLNA